MILQFCPVCKNLLQLKEENGKVIGFCGCGFKRMSGVEISLSEKSKINEIGKGVIEKDEYKEEINKLTYQNKKERKAEFWDNGKDLNSIIIYIIILKWNKYLSQWQENGEILLEL